MADGDRHVFFGDQVFGAYFTRLRVNNLRAPFVAEFIGELDQVWVLADVFEMDLPRIQMGSPATVRVVSFPDRSFTGKVDWISGAIDPATRTAKVRVVLDNEDRALRPEMYASVNISAPGHKALAVPRTAVLRQGDQVRRGHQE